MKKSDLISKALQEEKKIMEESSDVKEISEDERSLFLSLLKDEFTNST